MDKTIHGNSACIQAPFSAYMTSQLTSQLTEKPSAPFERAQNTGLYLGNMDILHLIRICT
jgi:hypothetical protein